MTTAGPSRLTGKIVPGTPDQADPNRLVKLWPTLAKPIRNGVMAMVTSAVPEGVPVDSCSAPIAAARRHTEDRQTGQVSKRMMER
jgi:hypothetical protein